MAKFVLSSMVSKISGSIGSLTFRSGSGGGCLYGRPPSKAINSKSLQEHKLIVAQANAEWAALSPEMKKFWKEASIFEQTHGVIKMGAPANGRLFFLGWRIRCLHAHVTFPASLKPPMPVYMVQFPEIDLFRVGSGFTYQGWPNSAQPPYPRSACWVSWSPNGTAEAGRTWKKFWPDPDHYQYTRVADGDILIYRAIGIPPEWRPKVSGFFEQKVAVRFRHYRVYPFGKIATCPDQLLWAPLSHAKQFYFKTPPDTPAWSGIAP